ncbi:MAG: adenylate/guanylate cyclase domain-containing protein [Chloroflexota bacterium]
MTGSSTHRALPTGTVTFLFSDVEGSTRLVGELEPLAYRDLLEQHHAILRMAFGRHGAVERGTQGDAFLVIFDDAPAAVAAAVEAQLALAAATWPGGAAVRVRMGLHTGQGIRGGDDYVGLDINRAARIAAAAHGGQVLVSDATRALVERSLPVGASLGDLGEHRLKDLTRSERIFQVVADGLPSSFPPLRVLDAAEGNLPVRLTSFVGRVRELGELATILEDARLVTLTGPGGTGKTSLAIALAGEVAGRFAHGAWFVPLQAVTDADLVPATIAATLGLVESRDATHEWLSTYLADRSLLLVLDNLEQVRSGAPFLGDLLRTAPGLRIVATSRAPLQLSAEQEYPVMPLSLPGPDRDPATAASVDSVRLFVERANRVQLGFSLTAENIDAVTGICTRLDGLPLGIELAAGRVRLLGAAAIADRIGRQLDLPGSAPRDLPERQRTLHSTISWSHELLDGPSRKLFARLAVFAGGWRIEEGDAVCGPSDELPVDFLEALSELAEQSLVKTSIGPDGPRFGLLETIRIFAAERLAEAGETDTIRRRHALSYLALAEASTAYVPGRDQRPWLARLSAEHDNLRAAIRWAIESGDAEVGLRLVAALWRFWQLAGHLEEGMSVSADVLKIPGADEPTTWRLKALDAVGSLYYWRGEQVRAGELYAEALEIARTLGDRRSIADAMFNLSFPTAMTHDVSAAETLGSEAARIYTELGDEQARARVEWATGSLMQFRGEIAASLPVLESALERFRQTDDVPYASVTMGSIGWAHMRLGHLADAIRYGSLSLLGYHALGDVSTTTLTLHAAAVLLATLGRPEEAAVVDGAFEALSRRYGVRPPVQLEQLLFGDEAIREVMSALREAPYAAAWARGRAMSIDEAVDYAVLAGEDWLAAADDAGPDGAIPSDDHSRH